MRKIASIFLIFIFVMSIFSTTISATDISSNSSSNGESSSGGGGWVGTVTKPAISLNTYTVSGTIYLPSGITAPKDGLKIYGGFGGVTLGEVSTMSVTSTDSYVEEEITINYENTDIIATIPEGQNSISYNVTCNIASTYDGIYGKFWVYDDIVCGTTILSNKQTATNITKIKSNVYEYSGLNCILNSATDTVSYSIECDSVLISEDINTDIYVIADDGYDKYISRLNFDNSISSVIGYLNIESTGEYDLYYYIPSSNDLLLQKIDKGLFKVGTLDTENLNAIILKSQLYISGKINLPIGYTAEKDLNITINTVSNQSDVILPKGATSTSYTVGAFSEKGEYLQIEIDDDYLVDGYLTEDGSFVEYEYDLWYATSHNPIDNYDITLEEQYIIKGYITLPDDITMSENTYFGVDITAKNLLTGYQKEIDVNILSNTLTTEYKIPIPKSESEDKFIISYDYGSYTSISPPTSATSPLKSFNNTSSGGGTGIGGGGGSGSSSGTIIMSTNGVSYTFEKPIGLLYNYRFFVNKTGTTFYEDNADGYKFTGRDIEKNFMLVKEYDDFNGMITGYFENYLDIEMSTPIIVTLYDEENKIVSQKQINGDEGYSFTELEKSSYKLGFEYENKQYYYNNLRLVDDIDNAEIISLENEAISSDNDVHYENIFKANIKLYFEEIVINDTYHEIQSVKIYDPFGNMHLNVDSDTAPTVKFSSFYIGIGDYYVSEFDSSNGVITEITDDIEKAYLFNSEYYNTINRSFYTNTKNRINTFATTAIYITPLTSTDYTTSDAQINFTVRTKQSIDEGELIVATYDINNRLISINSTPCIAGQYEYLVPVDYSSDIEKVKTMIWSGLNTLKPLGKVEEKTVEPNLIYQNVLKNISNSYFIVGENVFYRNGAEYSIELAPTYIDNVLYVTARALGEGLDCSVFWNADTQSIGYSLENSQTLEKQEYIIPVNSNIGEYSRYSLNDHEWDLIESKELKTSVPPLIVDGRTLVPFVDISEILGFEVNTSDDGNIITAFDEVNKKVKYAYDNNLINIDKVDISSMNGYVTRAEMASLLVDLYEYSTGNTIIPSNFEFLDIDNNSDIYEDMAKACTLQVISAYYDNTFNPDKIMTYAEVIKVIHSTVLKINENLADKYVTVPEYINYPLSGGDWATGFVYKAKKLGLLDGVCYNIIEVHSPAIRKDVCGIIANAFYQLSIADETEFLYICNSAEKHLGILNALQTDLYRYYAYDDLKTTKFEDELEEIARTMYSYCTYYNTVDEFDEILKTAFNKLFPSGPSSGTYS